MVDTRDPAGAPEPGRERRMTDAGTDELVVDLHGNVGAYAVDALDLPERAEFRAHLEFCPSCRLEVAEFREATAELALLMTSRPPTELRATTLGAVRGVRPLPPEIQRPAPVRPVLPQPPEDVAPLDDHPSIMPWSLDLGAPPVVEPRASAPVLNKMLLALAAAAVVISLALGGWFAYGTAQRAAEMSAARIDAQQRAQLLSAPDARIIPSTLDGVPVSYVVSEQQNRAMFIGDQVPGPGPGRVYQLWLISGDEAFSAGVLDTGGTVQRWLSGSVADAERLAVTLEPAPFGSSAPTEQPISSVPV